MSCDKNNQPSWYVNLINRHIILPQNLTTASIEKKWNHLGIKTITCTTKTIN